MLSVIAAKTRPAGTRAGFARAGGGGSGAKSLREGRALTQSPRGGVGLDGRKELEPQ